MSEHPSHSSTATVNIPNFPARPYQPDGGFTMPGVSLLLSTLALAGAALGFAAHFIGKNVFYLILVFPIGIGLGLGFLGTIMVKRGNVRNPMLGGLAGFLGGVLAMFMMHYFDYRNFQSEMAKHPEAIQKLAKLTDAQVEEAARALPADDREDFLLAARAARVRSFMQFMDLEARQGVEIKRTAGKGKGLNLGYTGSCIYWIVEVLIVAGITYFVIKKATAEPFCVRCEQWKAPLVMGALAEPAERASAALLAGRVGDLAAQASDQGNIRVTVATCPQCTTGGEIDVKLERITIDKQGKAQAKTVGHATLPGQAIAALQQVLTPPPPATEPPADAPPAAS